MKKMKDDMEMINNNSLEYETQKNNKVRKAIERCQLDLQKDPNNAKYKDSYDKLCKEMEFKNKNFTSGNGNMNSDTQGQPNRDFDPYDRQMGGNDCMQSCCECLACNMLLNCCCNCH